MPVYATLNLEMIASPNPVRPGEQLRYLITVSNQDTDTQLDNVTVEFPVPAGIFSFGEDDTQPAISSCSGSSCEPTE